CRPAEATGPGSKQLNQKMADKTYDLGECANCGAPRALTKDHQCNKTKEKIKADKSAKETAKLQKQHEATNSKMKRQKKRNSSSSTGSSK
ncbi:hypothetical protein EJB05_19321, partial [Eragrostis curvula]